MRIDLHSHSNVSDGTDPPAEVVRRAAALGLDVIALTDHDTAESWPEAVRAAEECGIALVPGMEISTRVDGESVHLLAYLPDADNLALNDALAKILDGRNSRVPAILERLRDLGIDIDIADVHRVAGSAAATGRPHIADALVGLGVVVDRDEAFARYLNPGRPAYVSRYAAGLPEAIRIATAAGAGCVLAHPWGRGRAGRLDEAAIAELIPLGLVGLEVDHQDHTPEQRTALRGIAANLGLLVTGSSDYHGTGKVNHDLGVHTTHPEQFERLLAACETAANTSGSAVPEVTNAR